MANRFQKVIPGSTYVPHNYEDMFKVGLLKDQDIQGIIDSGQDFLNTEGNYATIYNPDTEYKLDKVNSLVQGMNELTSQDLSDPVVQNKLRGLKSGFSNDPEVYGAIQRTNAYNIFLTRKKELGDKYRDQNADQFLADIEAYQMGDKDAGERLKLAPDIEPYTDWFKGEFIPTVEKLKADKTITGFGSNYLITTEGVTPERIQQLLLNGLSSEAYQQMQKDYNYEKRRGQTDKDWSEWVTEKAIAAGNIHSYVQKDAKYTGDINAQNRLKLAASQLQSNESGIPTPIQSSVIQQDLKSNLYKKFNTSGATKDIKVFTPYGDQTVNSTDPNYKNLINYLSENGGKAVFNLMKNLKSSGLNDVQISEQIGNILPQGVTIKKENGKIKLVGDDKLIENFMIQALTNENSNALGGYTVPNWNPESAKQLLALAATQGLTVSINDSSPTESAKALQTLLSDPNFENSMIASISPITQFGGRPSIVIFTPPKYTADEVIPGKKYSIGLDNYSQALFSDNTNLFNSKVNLELNTPIPLNNKSQFQIDGKTYQYDHGINTIEIDQNGNPSINTNIVFYDINDKDKNTPYYQDYDSWTQQEILPKFLNAPWNTPYKNKFNKSGFESVQYLLNTEQ